MMNSLLSLEIPITDMETRTQKVLSLSLFHFLKCKFFLPWARVLVIT